MNLTYLTVNVCWQMPNTKAIYNCMGDMRR